MSNNPLISIIVPIYNSQDFLSTCIESILKQSYNNYELILVDDGSTDNSFEICEQYKEKDDRLIIIKKKNEGASKARNDGICKANGDYISFIDSDDYVEKDFLSCLIQSALKYNSDVVVCGRYNVKGLNKKVGLVPKKDEKLEGITALKKMLKWDCMDFSPCDKLFRKSIWNNINFENYSICEDVITIFNCMTTVESVSTVPKPLYNYRSREKSRSKLINKNTIEDLIQITDKIKEIVDTDMKSLIPEAYEFILSEYDYLMSKLIVVTDTNYSNYEKIISKKMFNIIFSFKSLSKHKPKTIVNSIYLLYLIRKYRINKK